jgi:ribosomal protein L34E
MCIVSMMHDHYRDPKTNDCTECGAHLDGIEYPYVCGRYVRKEDAGCA